MIVYLQKINRNVVQSTPHLQYTVNPLKRYKKYENVIQGLRKKPEKYTKNRNVIDTEEKRIPMHLFVWGPDIYLVHVTMDHGR